MRDIRGIRQYRIVQEEVDKIIVFIVPGKDFGLEVANGVQEQISRIVKNGVHVHIRIVSELPREVSDKLRSVISKVPFSF